MPKGQHATILDLNAVKGYYNKVFTNELVLKLQKDIKIEDLIFSYSYYSNLGSENSNFDNYEISSDYLKSDNEIDQSNSNSFYNDKKFRIENEEEEEEPINYFDPNVSEQMFDDKIKKTFEYLNNFLKSFYTNNFSNETNDTEIINYIVDTLKVEKENDESYKIYDMNFDKSQISQITLIIIAYIIKNLFDLSLGRKLIFSNENINKLLLKAIYMQNIYIQIFTLKNLKKYLIEDGEYYDTAHLKMIKMCIFSKSLCSFNRANDIIIRLIKENKQVNEIFDYYFLKKLKKNLEQSDIIQRLRLLDLIIDCINLNNSYVYEAFKLESKPENDSINYEKKIKDIENVVQNLYNNNTQAFETCYTSDDVSFIDKEILKYNMDKNNLNINDVCKLIKINIYKYLIIIYLKNDLLLKINVLEIFSKLAQNKYFCNAFENTYFLHIILNDLNNLDEEILHINILNSLISYSNMSPQLLNVVINAHSNCLIKKINDYISDTSCINNENLIIGLKAFGYFFSINEASKIFLSINPNIYITAINTINTHAHTNVLRHAINIWIKILPYECNNSDFFKKIVHDFLFKKIITVLKEISDTIIQINIYELLQKIINYDITELIINEQWLIKSLQNNFESNTYDLKMSRYNFFKSLYKVHQNIIINNSYANNIINNFLEKVPSRY
ncbi:conserved Plasmodium protein, unknown function [Plasmodium chabaudi chabaudi]|uniref:Uncharacterized protein n=1 Tax=Plasmodium chabaudi chabaudi TaxID=31271 RepID=A0A4V0K484_PLACU|nr:conserved Plasmodium protein, unknown function [Plasmodium chabaudi chabaudi]VTZ67668.1 conserved Plasmodium protein, unknown function [Plasmodium chabaudi chabaudi]|eukprot:XP_016653407.1 conserved Plasmodium protein, unknown function [Plasmodium chabaudi chabaudi]